MLQSHRPLLGELGWEVSVESIEGVLVGNALALAVLAPAAAKRGALREPNECVQSRAPVTLVRVGGGVVSKPELERERIEEL